MKNRQVTRSANLESLVNLLRTGSDIEASTVLARLRLGDRVEDILQPLQAESFDTTPEPTGKRYGGSSSESKASTDACVPGSEVTADHSQPSTKGQHSMQVQGPITETTFLSIVLDMNDLRLTTTTTRTSAVHTTTKINHLESPLFLLPEINSQGDVSVRDSLALAHKWNRETATTQNDVQACFANFFGNLPISSAILANHQPPMIQHQQLRSLSIPVWAMLCSNKNLDPGSILPAFTNIRSKITEMLRQGTSWEDAVGEQPNVSALLSEDEFRKASLLSQWASSMVHSVKNEGDLLYPSLRLRIVVLTYNSQQLDLHRLHVFFLVHHAMDDVPITQALRGLAGFCTAHVRTKTSCRDLITKLTDVVTGHIRSLCRTTTVLTSSCGRSSETSLYRRRLCRKGWNGCSTIRLTCAAIGLIPSKKPCARTPSQASMCSPTLQRYNTTVTYH